MYNWHYDRWTGTEAVVAKEFAKQLCHGADAGASREFEQVFGTILETTDAYLLLWLRCHHHWLAINGLKG